MRFVSQASLSFIRRLEQYSRDILAREMGITTGRTRFKHGQYMWPIKIACFENPKILGYFEAESLLIGVNRLLMVQAGDNFLKNLLRHELAHYICYIRYGRDIADHGKEYRRLCNQWGWGKEVFNAKVDQTEISLSLKSNREEERILGKVKKLLALESSANRHESDLATLKANELIIKYNLEKASLTSLEEGDEEAYYVQVAARAKKTNETLRALSLILKNFLVQPILCRKENSSTLEMVGTRLNVELAVYTADFLQQEFERLWKKAQKENPGLKGIVAKNSFLRGMAKGLDKKLKTSKGSLSTNKKNLIPVHSALERAVAMAYPRLSRATSQSLHCPHGAALGEKAGKNISIHPGLKKGENNSPRLLT